MLRGIREDFKVHSQRFSYKAVSMHFMATNALHLVQMDLSTLLSSNIQNPQVKFVDLWLSNVALRGFHRLSSMFIVSMYESY